MTSKAALAVFYASISAVFPAAATNTTTGDPKNGGALATQVCAACHGANGNSTIPMYPELAGQHAEYITKQLSNYKSGARKNAIMQTVAATLLPQDMADLGAYFEGAAPRAGVARDQALVNLGRQLYRGGEAKAGIPACSGCHAPDGSGIPAQYPRLAGQHREYTVTQLKNWRTGERANDAGRVMQTIASRLSDKQIEALAEYTAGLR